MCDSFEALVEKRAKEAAKEAKTAEAVTYVKKLMEKLKISVEEAMDMLDVSGAERKVIIARIN